MRETKEFFAEKLIKMNKVITECELWAASWSAKANRLAKEPHSFYEMKRILEQIRKLYTQAEAARKFVASIERMLLIFADYEPQDVKIVVTKNMNHLRFQ